MICYICNTELDVSSLVTRVNPKILNLPGPWGYCPECKIGQIDFYLYKQLTETK